MPKLLFGTLVSIVCLIVIQHLLLTGFDKSFGSSLVANLMIEGISILVTVFIISILLKKHEEQKEMRTINDLIGNKLKLYFCEISGIYINFIKKEPMAISGENIKLKHFAEDIKNIVHNIDGFVVADFQNTPVRFHFYNGKDLNGIFHLNEIDYQNFCENAFKPKIRWAIGELIHQYISIMPDGLRKSVYSIENAISSVAFETPLQYGIQAPIPVDKGNMTKLKKELLIIGNELLNIYQYIE